MTDEAKRRFKNLALAGLFPVLLGLPFIGRAFFVDDHYHVLMAKQILQTPSRPYDFIADDAGPDHRAWERGQPPRMVNPPLHHYILAGFLRLSHDRVWAARLGFVVLAGFCAVFAFRLAQYFIVTPGPATLLIVLSPAFWLGSYSLLIDSTMLFFGLAGLWAWVAGLRRSSAVLTWSGAGLLGLCLLTKYTGGLFLIMALIWLWMKRTSWRDLRPALAFSLPAAMLLGWSFWTASLYGAPHILAASRRVVHSFQWPQVVVFLSFFSGSFLFPLLSWRFAWTSARRLFAMSAVVASAGTVFLAGPMGGFPPVSAFLLAFFVATSLVYFGDMLMSAKSMRSEDRFLLMWLLLGALQMVLTVGWVASRYYLTILLPAALLTWRRAEDIFRFSIGRKNFYKTLAAGVMFLAGAALCTADYFQAEASRQIVRDTQKDGWPQKGARGYYMGDSFTDSGLKESGWIPAFPETPLRTGDLILSREVTMPHWWYRQSRYKFMLIKTYEYPARFPVHVMDNRGSAGFYASVWGALPFSVSREPWERYRLYQVVGE